jgi:hypothetical protein
MMSDDVSDGDSIDDGEQCEGVYVEPTESFWECAEGDDHCCNEVDATDSCFHWKGQDPVGWDKVKSSTHMRRKWKNILTNLLGIISQAK